MSRAYYTITGKYTDNSDFHDTADSLTELIALLKELQEDKRVINDTLSIETEIR